MKSATFDPHMPGLAVAGIVSELEAQSSRGELEILQAQLLGRACVLADKLAVIDEHLGKPICCKH